MALSWAVGSSGMWGGRGLPPRAENAYPQEGNVQTVAEVLARLPRPSVPELPAPAYRPPADADDRPRVGLAVESMRSHVTDEGAQLFDGLKHAGYVLHGHAIPCEGYPDGMTDVAEVLRLTDPRTVLLNDRREWLGLTAGRGHDPRERFRNTAALRDRPDAFTLTVIKDAHTDGALHQESATEIGCHAWVTPYSTRVVKHLAPYVRERHLVRTYHTVDAGAVPPFSVEGRGGCVLSGAMNARVYPLRCRLARELDRLPLTTHHAHPGYRRDGARTPAFLKTLSRFKVAICTSSIYGYALRKLVEATACGCTVLTDLPSDDVLPGIDGNLVRVHPGWPTKRIAGILREMLENYDPERQRHFADVAQRAYDYRAEGVRLAGQIESLRMAYP